MKSSVRFAVARAAFATTALMLAFGLAACGGGPTDAPTRGTTAAATQEAVSRVGDVTIRASVLPTTSLAPEIATRYGIERDERTLMLLVGMRKGADAEETSLPARITAVVTNLGGQRRDIPMREVRIRAQDGTGAELLDYVGMVETDLPDKLRFDLTIVREDGGTSTMRFEREFFPR